MCGLAYSGLLKNPDLDLVMRRPDQPMDACDCYGMVRAAIHLCQTCVVNDVQRETEGFPEKLKISENLEQLLLIIKQLCTAP